MSHDSDAKQTAPGGVGLVFLAFICAVMLARLVGDEAIHNGLVSTALEVFALAAFAIAVPRCRGLTLWVSIALSILGIALVTLEGQWADWLSGMTALAPVLAIIIFAQLLAEPIEIGGYHRELIRVLESHVRWRNARLHVALFASFLFTCMAAGGALAATYRVLVRPEDDKEAREGIMRSSMRGAGAAIGLTPITGTFGVTVTLTGVSAPVLFLYALPAAAVTLVLAFVACTVAKSEEAPQEDVKPADPWRLGQLALALAGLLTGIVLFGTFLDIRSIDAIIFSILAVGLSWLWLLNPGGFPARLKGFPKRIVASTAPSVALFIPAGALAMAVSGSPWAESLIGDVLSVVTERFMAFAVGGSIWLLFHLGIHPAVAVAIVGPVAMSTGLVSPKMMAFLALAGGGTSVMSSPFGGLANLAAAVSGRSVFDVGLRSHLMFSFVSLVVSITLARLFLF